MNLSIPKAIQQGIKNFFGSANEVKSYVASGAAFLLALISLTTDYAPIVFPLFYGAFLILLVLGISLFLVPWFVNILKSKFAKVLISVGVLILTTAFYALANQIVGRLIEGDPGSLSNAVAFTFLLIVPIGLLIAAWIVLIIIMMFASSFALVPLICGLTGKKLPWLGIARTFAVGVLAVFFVSAVSIFYQGDATWFDRAIKASIYHFDAYPSRWCKGTGSEKYFVIDGGRRLQIAKIKDDYRISVATCDY